MSPRPYRPLPQEATELGPDTLWLHAEHTCLLSGVDRSRLEGFFERFADGHMDEHPFVKGHLYDFEVGVGPGKLELCFSASAAFEPERLPGGFILTRAAYRTSRKLLFAVEESLRFHQWGPWAVTSMALTVWRSGTDDAIMTMDYTPDLEGDGFHSLQYPSG